MKCRAVVSAFCWYEFNTSFVYFRWAWKQLLNPLLLSLYLVLYFWLYFFCLIPFFAFFQVPRMVEGLMSHHCSQVAAAKDHTVVLTEEGYVYTFGLNTFHQLGLVPPPASAFVPKQVGGSSGSCWCFAVNQSSFGLPLINLVIISI